MNIGNVTIDGVASLAPMAGVADRAFREMCVEFGAAYTVGEMASSKGIVMNDRKSAELLYLSPEERPAAVQLFGDDPVYMAKAAERAMEFSPQVIDINMGCPAPKVASSGGGASLMKNPILAREIVAATVSAVPVPVTVKLRSGWDDETLNAVEVAKYCEDAGASAITVHGRTRVQMYAPPVNIGIIREVVKAVNIPVIANGDVVDGVSAAKMYDETGCALVAVGRGALGRPWVFRQINEYMATGKILPELPVGERMEILRRHITKLCEYKGAYIGMREARKHAAWYTKGMRCAAAFRREMCSLTTLEELYDMSRRIEEAATE